MTDLDDSVADKERARWRRKASSTSISSISRSGSVRSGPINEMGIFSSVGTGEQARKVVKVEFGLRSDG